MQRFWSALAVQAGKRAGLVSIIGLIVTLVLGAAVLFVLLGLFLPMVGLWNSLGGAGGSKK